MFDHAPILLADLKEVLGALVPLAFLLLWVISQLVEAKKLGKQPGGRKPAAPQPPRGPAPAQPGQGRAVGEPCAPLAGPRPQAPPAAAPASEIEVLLDDRPAAAERGRLAQPLRPLDQRGNQRAGQSTPASAPRRMPRRPVASRPGPESVAAHVAEHVDAAARALAERSARLGDRVIQADEQFDVQLKAKFDHRLGTLASERDAGQQERPAAPAADAPARQIAAMLADPAGVRQAIVLSEILNRPVDRW
jgi:hypothetical protein